MGLRDEIAEDVERLLLQTDDFAEEITLNGHPITAIVDPVIDQATGKVVRSMRQLFVGDADRGGLTPTAGMTGSIGGKTIRVVEIESGGPGGWVIIVDIAP